MKQDENKESGRDVGLWHETSARSRSGLGLWEVASRRRQVEVRDRDRELRQACAETTNSRGAQKRSRVERRFGEGGLWARGRCWVLVGVVVASRSPSL